MSEEAPPPIDAVAGAAHPAQNMALFGQEMAEQQFIHAFENNQLHHAWLISGPNGIGKATLAWRIARFLVAPKEARSNGSLFIDPEHPTAQQTANLNNPNILRLVRPYDAARKRYKTAITIDEVRRLKNFFALSATENQWRAAIIDPADELNNAAANALLKILEEPPARVIFLLVSHQPFRLLPTIRSRCRMLNCNALASDEVKQILQANNLADPSPLLLHIASGAAGRALSLAQIGGDALYRDILDLLAGLPQLARPKINQLQHQAAKDPAQLQLIIELLAFACAQLARQILLQHTDAPESAIASRFSGPAAAQKWADDVQAIQMSAQHAIAVNLDPGQIILDTCLRIETTAKQLIHA